MNVSLKSLEKPLRICVRNFWKGAFKNDFFSYLLNEILPNSFELVEDQNESEVVFSSVFGDEKTDIARTIFYTGENLRIDLRRAAFFLSFETDSWGGRNCYLPFWMLKVAWSGRKIIAPAADHYHATESLLEIDRLLERRPVAAANSKSKFCALIASNPEPMRINLMAELSRYRQVDGFGPAFGRADLRSKSEILGDYRFVLCPENSFYPGYVTEKLLEAYSAGAVPIYFGGIPDGACFNLRSFLDYGRSLDTAQLLAAVVALDTIPELYSRMYGEPLLLAKPSIDPVSNFVGMAIENILAR